MADIFDVVADSTRRELLARLLEHSRGGSDAGDGMSVGALVEALGLTQPTVSKHLRVLRDAKLVAVREEGQHRFYRLTAEPLDELASWLVPFASADAAASDAADGSPSHTVFAAWAGSELPTPLRRVAESIDHAGDTGAAVGRSVADASHQVRSVIDDVAHNVERRVIRPIKERFARSED